MKKESHYFTVMVDPEDIKDTMEKVRQKLVSKGAVITIFDVDFEGGECRFGFAANSIVSENVFMYLATLKNCRVYM